MLETILTKAKKHCQEAEVFAVSSVQTPVSFETNRLKYLDTRYSSGIALRIIKDGRIGFAATTRPGEAESLVEMALETAQFGAEARFEFPSHTYYPPVEVYDPAVEAVSIEHMVELGQSLIDAVRSHTPEILCEAGVTKTVSTMEILNSRGGNASFKKSVFALSAGGTLVRGTDMLFVGETQSSCQPIADGSSLISDVIQQLERAQRTAPAPTGATSVIFTPRGVASALVMPLAIALNGRTVLQGASPLGQRRGERVADERFSLWNDSTLPFRPRSRPCDDEGVPSQRTPLIEKGMVANFLYDLQTAALAGARSTGSASRSLGSLPSPGMSTLILGEGDASFAEMLADMQDGLVVEMLMGAGQGNVLGGDFSGNVLLGYRVQGGEITGRVKDTMVAGNAYQLLNRVVAIGKEAQWVWGTLKAPPIYCQGLSVAGKG